MSRSQGVGRGIHQLLIVHLSDPHFGSKHGFGPPLGPSGQPTSAAGIPSLTEHVLRDLRERDPGCPVVVGVTGDLASECKNEEFVEAAAFVRALANEPVFGMRRGLDGVVIVPGNHDIDFGSDDPELKWAPWCKFFNDVYGTPVSPGEPLTFCRLHAREGQEFVVLTLNSTMYVKKGSDDQFRGQLDERQLAQVQRLLDEKRDIVGSSIRIALVHHHPVLIPQLVEAGKQYDAIVNAGLLLNILHRYGFHVVLHGHKHWPCAFTSDACSAYDSAYIRPLVVVSGGSVGAADVAQRGRKNCYNRVWVKWNSGTDEVRVRVETRGLNREDTHGQPLLASDWYWDTIRVLDRSFYRRERIPEVTEAQRDLVSRVDESAERLRKEEYTRSRLNLPVIEVRPSLDPDQAYDAVFWIVGHSGADGKDYRKPEDIPRQVTWSAGKLFEQITVTRRQDPRFAGMFSYYGPMLIQADLEFGDGTHEYLYAYARIPSGSDYVNDGARE